MTSKSKQIVTIKNKESNLSFIDDISLSSSEDEIGFQYFFHDQIEKDFVEDSTEAEVKARISWNNLNSATKKSYLKSSKVGEYDNRKLLKSRKPQRSPSPNGKKIKKDIQNNENSILKNENEAEQLFQMEIQRLVASPAQYCFQPVCCVCEIYTENNAVLQCNGVCKRYFHLDCLKNLKENHPILKSNFQCMDCFSSIYRCILCGKVDKMDSLLSCENSDCGRLYHRSCLEIANFNGLEIFNNRILSCPAHYCISCVREDVTFAQNPCKKLIECLRCPLSFHCNDFCMAAGAYELSLSHVICPHHFEGKLVKLNPYKPFHPAWCFKCFKTGVKLLCNYCPSSFHIECVDDSPDIKSYVCYNCRNNRQPRYGEILFVKVSQYRWWPCEIIHPRNAPMNILKLNRPDGTYPVLFLGSNEYQWVAKTRSIDFNTAQQSSIFKDSGGTTRMDRDFSMGLKAAVKIHQVFVNILLIYVPLKSMSAPPMTDEELYPYMNVKEINQKTVKFKLIKANILVSPAKLPPKMQPSICDCVESCQLFQCKNYINKIECQVSYCPNAKSNKCKNQQFTNHVNKNLAVSKTPNRGFGFKTMVAIKKKDFIIEYLGELITKSESQVRMQNSKKFNAKDFYMIKLTGDLIIDAGPKGNLSRYINHSCDPNCYLENWIVNGYPRKGVFALKDIEPDQELTFDYRISGVIMKEDTFCLCGSNNCTGFLGPIKSLPSSPIKAQLSARNSATSLATEINEKLSVIHAKDDLSKLEKISTLTELPIDFKFSDESIESFKDIPLNSSDENIDTDNLDSTESKTVHENICYRCFDGGKLVLCDKTNCPKTYHLSCLGLEVAPPGTWYCPWHFCDICGKPSKLFCVRCPASFCDIHAEEKNIVLPELGSRKSVCQLHRNGNDLHNNQKLKLENISPTGKSLTQIR